MQNDSIHRKSIFMYVCTHFFFQWKTENNSGSKWYNKVYVKSDPLYHLQSEVSVFMLALVAAVKNCITARYLVHIIYKRFRI